MDIDEETKGAGSSTKRKAEEEPGEESKKARVGVYVRTGNSRRQLIELCRATPNAQTVRLISSDYSNVQLTYMRYCRDRENCTVFVGDLPTGTIDDDLTQLFKDVCSFSYLWCRSLTK